MWIPSGRRPSTPWTPSGWSAYWRGRSGKLTRTSLEAVVFRSGACLEANPTRGGGSAPDISRSMTMGEAYIVAATRTAGGRKGGRLREWHPADLGAVVLDELMARTGADPALVEDVVMGCVMQVGEQSTNIARGAVLASKLPESVPATSVDRQCGSSQQALQFAAQAVMSGTQDIVIAAGVESMTRVPMGLS